MSTKKLILPVAGFTNGLNTEANVLNVLPSEFRDGSVNVELLANGSVRRRKAVDFLGTSTGGTYLQTITTGTTSTELVAHSPSCARFRLTAPNGDIIERIILAVDGAFRIYEVTATALRNLQSPYQTISFGTNADSTQKNLNIQFAVSGSRIYFSGKRIKPGYLYVSADNVSLAVTYIDVLIRNVEATGANARVSHNSKWYECVETHTSAATSEPGVGATWTRYWFQLRGAIPAGTAAWATATSYTSWFIKRYNKLNTVAATDTFPSTVEFFGGRLWLSGDPKYPNSVFFTQVISSTDDIEKFHQFADPFDATDPAVVDSDGGVLSVQGAGLFKRLLAISNTLFLACNTGIWQITGPDGIFKATNYANHLVLNDGVDGPDNIVRADKEILVFGITGIWKSTIETSLTSTVVGKASFKTISQNRVDLLYSRIPRRNKASARALYNPSDSRVYYFYNEARLDFDNSFNPHDQPVYARDVLVVDTRFQDDPLLSGNATEQKTNRSVKGAFFKYTLDDSANSNKPYIATPFICKDITAADETVTSSAGAVTAGGVSVVAGGNDESKDVVLFVALQRLVSGTTVTIKGAFGTFNTTSLQDWFSDATYKIAYSSKIITGVQTMGDVSHKKAATYLYFVFKKIESGVLDGSGDDITPGGCFLRTAWNWAVNSASAKYSAQFQIYVPNRLNYAIADSGDDGHDHTWYKHRARGRGNSLSLTIENDGNKDFHLIGWTQQFYGKGD